MARIRFFFRVPSHQRFEYKPRYYDPDKEELEKILKRAEAADSTDPEDIKLRMQTEFERRKAKGGRRGYADRSFRRSQVRKSNTRLFLIIATLLLAAYYFAIKNIPDFVEWFGL